MPEIITVDVKELKRKKIMKDTFLPLLVEKVRELYPGVSKRSCSRTAGDSPDDRVSGCGGASLRELRR